MSHAEIRERAEEMKQALDNAEIGWPHGGMFDQFVEDVMTLLAEVERLQRDYDMWIEGKRDDPEFVRLHGEVDRYREALAEYAEHTSWRCAYRSRYKKCVCGLDETMEKLGLPLVEVQDPEAVAVGGDPE